MLVTKNKLSSIINKLSQTGEYAVDCETSGLFAHLGDRLFSIIIASYDESYYFNFQHYDGIDPELVLSRDDMKGLQQIFDNQESTFFAHNAIFDMSMLAADGLYIKGTVHCTQAIQRVLINTQFQLSLDACVKPLGLAKSSAVDEYLEKHKLWEWEQIPGKKKKTKKYFFAKVPFEIMSDYGRQDGKVTRVLGIWQKAQIDVKRAQVIAKKQNLQLDPFTKVYANEIKLTKTCFNMHQEGFAVDPDYCEKAIAYEQERIDTAMAQFKASTGFDFEDSRTLFEKVFTAAGEKIYKTDKGRSSFDDDVLSSYTSEVAGFVKTYRDASKRANTYFRNYIYFCDADGKIHCKLNQWGADTGRFSSSDPNLQNVPKEDTSPWPVRKAFLPPPDHCLVMIDYDQVEYRLMLNYAKEMSIIKKILEDGLDVHTATAQSIGCSRQHAKTINFMLIYGGGPGKLAASLGISLTEAEQIRNAYFDKLPQIEKFIWGVRRAAKQHLMIVNWLGRVCFFREANDSYKAGNTVIQGGVADIIKVAMNRLDDFLYPYRSRQILQVHDELIFAMHKDELHLIPELVKIMEGVYTHGPLPLTAGVSHSWHNWFDKVEGLPSFG